MEWGAVIAGLVTIAGLLVKAWIASEPQRKKEASDEKLQQGRQDLESGNVDAVIKRIDGVLSTDTGPGCGDAGSEGGVLESGSTDTVRRLGNFDIRNG